MKAVLLDVFTDTRFTGNQLAVFLDGAEVPEALRQDVAREIGFSETVVGDPSHAFVRLEEYRSVTPADVRRVAREVLSREARTVIRVRRGRARA